MVDRLSIWGLLFPRHKAAKLGLTISALVGVSSFYCFFLFFYN